MLKDLTNEKLIRLNIDAKDWEDAVRKSAQPLIDEGYCKQTYVDSMSPATLPACSLQSARRPMNCTGRKPCTAARDRSIPAMS